MNQTRRLRIRRNGGFTLIELLVVLVILGLAMALGVPAIQNFIIRSRTEGYAREVATLVQRSRLEAIRMNRTAAVYQDDTNGQIVAFLDADRNLELAPDPGEAFRTTDYELGRLSLPPNVEFRDNDDTLGSAAVDGLTTVLADGSNHPAAIFRPDGSVLEQMPGGGGVQTTFAFRIADDRDNYLEVRVEPLPTAKVELRKWQNGRWLGAGDPGEPGFEPWEWN